MAEINIGMVGYAFMGKAHSNAWRQAPHFFPAIPRPRLKAICGRTRPALERAAAQLGWESVETDWRRLLARKDIDVVDIVTPGDSHAEIAIAAAQAGKHVLCEKPLANSLAEAQAMVAAADAAGVCNMVLFNYRRVPAIALAQRFIAEGKLGRIFHYRAQYLQDWIVDPEFPRVWRLDKTVAGSGALGDLGAHIADLALFLVGPVDRVSALTVTMIPERPLPDQPTKRAPVTVDDSALFLGKIGEVTASFEVTRLAPGRKNYLAFEINGSRGSLRFNLERLNELEFYDRTLPDAMQGWNNIMVTDGSHPYLAHWWPAGHVLGYEHTFVNAMADFLAALGAGGEVRPNFAEGAVTNAVLDAVERSARSGRWESVASLPRQAAG
ncbi:MAG: Gfo/Idh/MocA family protein [Terriglobales bacterium]